MTKNELIKKLLEIEGNPNCFVQMTEPYDDEEETYTEILVNVQAEEDNQKIILS